MSGTSLGRKLTLRIAALIVGVILLGAAALWGVVRLSDHFDIAEDRYEQLRAIYEIGHRAAVARLLIDRDAGTDAVRQPMREALQRAEALRVEPARTLGEAERTLVMDVIARLREGLDDLEDTQPARPGRRALNATLNRVTDLAQRINQRIVANRRAATTRLGVTLALLTALTAVIMIATIAIGRNLYLSVMRPLRRLQEGVRKLSEADFNERLPTRGDREFADLAERFNRTAGELERLYDGLEQEVQTKSRQLIRSERLAGIGYLAAGVAHEINNPLGIISGYAESALRRMERANALPRTPDACPPTAHADATARVLRVICEETHRCKAITTQLLQLGRTHGGQRESIDLTAVCERVTDMLAGLPRFRHRSLELNAAHGSMFVDGDEAELMQLVINIVTNALESVEDGAGHVELSLGRRGNWIELRVCDNGRGMDEATLGSVFEPFFTDKPSRDDRGTGLGLAVSHAIVTQHGGRLRAHSDGPGRGSTFIVELATAQQGETVPHE